MCRISNTGNDFRYNDKWDEDPNDTGLGEFVAADDRARYTKWMKFMYPRLQMMHLMLKPGGVLAICIDHRELFCLGQMLDELFQPENRLAIINWQKTVATKSDKTHVSTSTEYVLVYAKDARKAKTSLLPRDNRRYSNPDNDPLGDWREGNLTARTWVQRDDYAIQSPLTGELHTPAGGGAWRHPKRNIKRWLEEWGTEYEEVDLHDGRAPALLLFGGKPAMISKQTKDGAEEVLSRGQWPFIWFGRDGKSRPRAKTYLHSVKQGRVPTTWWIDDDELQITDPVELDSVSWGYKQSGRSSDGVNELTDIVGSGHSFETVKPLKLFSKIIQLWCPPNGHVVDPFAGSGTTGHAVLGLNSTTGTARRFTLIEQGRPERGDSYARSLTAGRLRRVITGEWAKGSTASLGGGFCFRQLTRQVDSAALLQMERDDMVDTVIASYFDSSRRRGSPLERYSKIGYAYLVAKNSENEGFYLVWDGPDMNTDFTEAVYETCVKEGRRAELAPIYHVYARLNLFSTDGVQFYQIPDRILADFGLNGRTESDADEEAS